MPAAHLRRPPGVWWLGPLIGAVAAGLALAQVAGERTPAPVIPPSPTTEPVAPESAPALFAATQPAELPPEFSAHARQTLVTGLVGSKHDFTHAGRVGRHLCLPCHTPHLVAAPLATFDQRPATTQPLRPYQGTNVELTGWSLLCLGCHDGVTAPDVYSTKHAIQVVGELGNWRFGTPGLRSHPLGVRYPPPGTGYNPPAILEAAGLPLTDGTIQCTTCHDAHNTARIPGFLRISNERSQLCLTCHRL